MCTNIKKKDKRDAQTCLSSIHPSRNWIIWSVNKVISLCHNGLLHHLVARHANHLVTTKAKAEHIPMDISQLGTTEEDTMKKQNTPLSGDAQTL